MLVLVLCLGLHWALLQSVAWVGMIVAYSQDASISEAVTKTFDGNHPCPLCKAIKSARADERQNEAKQNLKPGSKLELGVVWQAQFFAFSVPSQKISPSNSEATIRSDEPPKPRPRTA